MEVKLGYYRLEKGSKVEIFAERPELGFYCMIGIAGGILHQYSKQGAGLECFQQSIVSEWKEPEVIERWTAIYRNGLTGAMKDKVSEVHECARGFAGIIKMRIVDGKLESVEKVVE